MGSGSSKSSTTARARTPPPPPSPTFREPWRKVSWGNNQEDLDYVKAYQPEVDGIKHLRVLLYGPVGTGKSSFINSISNTLRRRMTQSAGVSSMTSDTSFTRRYQTHKIEKGARGNFFPFVFNDVMGLEEQTGRGVRVDDIKLAMMGHVKDGYMFKTDSPLSCRDLYYNSSPSPDDKVHVLVCVHSANSADIEESTLQKMKEIRELANDLGIPQLAVGTKIDEACGETEKDLKNVYKSKYIKQKMQEFSSRVGVPVNCIFPVKNYSEEDSIVDDVDTLILRVLKLILDFGDDFIYKMSDQSQ